MWGEWKDMLSKEALSFTCVLQLPQESEQKIPLSRTNAKWLTAAPFWLALVFFMSRMPV